MRIATAALLVAAVAVAVYLPALDGEFVMDDAAAIVKNADLRPSTPWRNLLKNDYWGTPIDSEASHKSFRPLTVFTFRWNYMLHGLNTYGYHVANVAFHAVSAFLAVFVADDVLASSVDEATVAGLFFALHPIHTESVSSVVGRAETLSACFFFLTFLVYKHQVLTFANDQRHCRSLFGLLPVFLLAFVAMNFKEGGLTVLGLCIVADFCGVFHTAGRQDAGAHRQRTSSVIFLCLRSSATVLFLLGCLAFRVWLCDTNFSPTFSDVDNYIHYAPTDLSRRLSYAYLHFRYAWLLLFPVSLSCDWSYEAFPLVHTFSDVRLVGPALVYSIAIGLCIWAVLRRNRTILIAVVGLGVVPFVPSSNILFPVATVIGERLLFLPSLGFCILLARGTFMVITPRLYRHAVVGVVCALYASKTLHRNDEWSTAVGLFKSAANVVPRSCKAQVCVAAALNDLGTQEARIEALSYINASFEIKKTYAGAHYLNGVVLRELGKLEASARAFQHTIEHSHRIEYKPDVLYLGLANLGALYLRLDKSDEAWAGQGFLLTAHRVLIEANALEPTRYAPMANLAEVSSKMGQLDEALMWYTAAADHKEVEADLFNNFAIAKYKLAVRDDPGKMGMGSIDEISSLYRRALKIDRNHVNARKNLGKIYYRKKDFAEAGKHFEVCNTYAPSDGVCLYELAKCRMRQGRWEDSVALMERLLLKLQQNDDTEERQQQEDKEVAKMDLSSVNVEQARKNLETARRVVMLAPSHIIRAGI
jgi:tetratricopeptide (TPR) repeat protein